MKNARRKDRALIDETLLPRRLREAREAAGLTQEGLAILAHIGGGGHAISHFEGGRRSPSIWHLAALATALGRSTDWLLGIGCAS